MLFTVSKRFTSINECCTILYCTQKYSEASVHSFVGILLRVKVTCYCCHNQWILNLTHQTTVFSLLTCRQMFPQFDIL